MFVVVFMKQGLDDAGGGPAAFRKGLGWLLVPAGYRLWWLLAYH